MKLLFNDLEMICNSTHRQKVDYSKAYSVIPAIIGNLVKLWRFHWKYTSKSYAPVDVDDKGAQINILGYDCPAWLKSLCGDVLAHCFGDRLKNGDYKLAFVQVDVG